MRKIIQIAPVSDGKMMFVLCDDGSVWMRGKPAVGTKVEWQRIENVPQDDSDAQA